MESLSPALQNQSLQKNDNNFKKSFFRNVLISGGYNYFAQGLTFLSSIIIARLLSPENYGLVGLITVFTGFISVFADSGISLAIIKSDYGYTYHKSLDTLALIMGIILCTLTIAIAFPIASFYQNPDLVLPAMVLGLTFILKSLSIVRGAILSKQLNFAYIGKVLLISNVITIVLTIILAYRGLQHWAIIIPQLLAAVVTAVLYERKLALRFNYYFSWKHLTVAFRYTKALIASLIGFNLVNYWSRNTDNLIVGKQFGMNDLGIYNRAYSLLALPLILITSLFGSVLYPSLKKLKTEGGDVKPEYMFVLKIISGIVFPISCVLILCPDLLVQLLWGEKWAKVAVYLPYFGLLVFSQPLLSTIGNFLVLQGKERTLMYSGWISSLFIVSSIVIGATFSMMAMVQTYALCFLLIVLPFNIVFVYYYKLKFSAAVLLRFWLPILSFSIGVWFGCFLDIPLLKHTSIGLLGISILLSSLKEIKLATNKIFRRLTANKKQQPQATAVQTSSKMETPSTLETA
jgi:O-antigen/teichoic acid export membrane protein